MKFIGDSERFRRDRQQMVDEQLKPRRITDKRVLKAMGTVPRHLFIDQALAPRAYGDHPLPIPENQTISQPYIVAAMTQALELKGTERVLEIGTGSGYQTAILSLLCRKVYSIERHHSLAVKAESFLLEAGVSNVLIRVYDGTHGWVQEAPFDAIMASASSPTIPQPLIDQLAEGGNLVMPMGDHNQQVLYRLRKAGKRVSKERLGAVQFVPLIGKYGWQPGQE